MRTQDEIMARLSEVEPDDWMGFRREVLSGYLDWEHVQPMLKPDHTTSAEAWGIALAIGRANLGDDARGYLTFAIGKALDHRGISASRSVDKLSEYAWLMGRDDAVAAIAAASYPQYGVPKLRAFAETMGWLSLWPDIGSLYRMQTGQACQPEGCLEGCGR